MRIKSGTYGASISGLRPEAVLGAVITMFLFQELGFNWILSCGVEGRHSRNSLHFVGLAFDLSFGDIDEKYWADITQALRLALGDEFDVVQEGDHWHIEFQPERRK